MKVSTVFLLLLTLLYFPQTQKQNYQYQRLKKAGGVPLKLSSGWTLVQNNIQAACNAGNSCSFAACTGGTGSECIAPTVAGSVWIVSEMDSEDNPSSSDNVTISSVSGGGGTWSLCPSSSCHVYDGTQTQNSDLAYNLSGTTGTQSFTVTLSGSTSSKFVIQFAEFLPPSGYTASFDTSGHNDDATCPSQICAGPTLSLTATDFVYVCCEYEINGQFANGGAPWTSPYLTSPVGNGIGLNVSAGSTSPTVLTTGAPGIVTSAIAFKSSAGPFVFTGSTNFSLVQYVLPTRSGASAGQVTCSPACPALTGLSSTGSGNLLFLVEGDTGASGRRLSSITDNKSETWTIPTGTGTCGANSGISCAYVLSSTSGVTSITPTLTGSTSNAGFSLWEFHRSSGSWTLDVQGAKTNTSTTLPVSPTITCTGTNDVVISAIAASGGVSGMQYGMIGFSPSADLNLETSSPFDPSDGALLNTTNCGPFTFPFENGGSFSPSSFTVAFQ